MARNALTAKKRVASGKNVHKANIKATSAASHLQKGNPALAGLTNHCFGCSAGNRHGLHLRFHEDRETGRVECIFRLAHRFEGPPGHAHGGIIATILDEAMGKVNRPKGIVALTRRMTVDYLQPVPLGRKLRAVGWPVKQDGRKHFHAGEIQTLDGVVLARSEGMFIAVDPAEMLRKYGSRIAGSNTEIS